MSEQRITTENQQSTVPVVNSASEVDSIDLVELFLRLVSSWKLILCLAIVGALVAGVCTFCFITPMYSATSIIYVLNRDSAISISDLNLGTALTNDYIKVFSMWEVHEEVIKSLDLPYSYKETRNMLTVSNSSNTRMLDITITSPSAEEAALLANEFARVGREYIQQTMATDLPRTMSKALVPQNPVSPHKTRNIVVGFLLGMLAAAGYITLRMMLDDKYKTPEDIRRYTGLVVLASVPRNTGSDDGKKSKGSSSRYDNDAESRNMKSDYYDESGRR